MFIYIIYGFMFILFMSLLLALRALGVFTRNFWVLHLKPGKVVRCLILYKDKRIRAYYVEPKNNTVTCDGRTYVINDEDVYLTKGVPTYVYYSERPEPINMFDVPNSDVTPADLNIAINSQVASEILDSMGGKLSAQMAIMIGVAVIIGFVSVFGYLLWNEMTVLKEMVDNLTNVIREVTGR